MAKDSFSTCKVVLRQCNEPAQQCSPRTKVIGSPRLCTCPAGSATGRSNATCKWREDSRSEACYLPVIPI